jgi:citrate synthase
MVQSEKTKNIGLRGIVVADTKISHSDGEQGILIYRGYRVEELAAHATYEETAYLLLYGDLPAKQQLQEFRSRLAQERHIPPYLVDCFKRFPPTAQPMDVLQASIPVLGMDDPEQYSETREANMAKAIRLIARIPAVVAGWETVRTGRDFLPPDKTLSHAEHFLWQLTGKKPDPETARDLDAVLVLHADHSFGASTFMGRGVASTQAHLYACVAACVGALSGRLHGGANAQVMKMLLAIRDEKDVPGWVRSRLGNGERIPGIGNAIFKTGDPRAQFLREMCGRLGEKFNQKHWWRILSEIEKIVLEEFKKEGKTKIQPNMDFYSAPIYAMMGIKPDLMTPTFAVSRIAGWTAHIIEEKFGDAQGKPTLYRPSSAYVGRPCGKTGCVHPPDRDEDVKKSILRK